MTDLPFRFAGQAFIARPSGALYWPDHGMLILSDLHLGKSERMARRGGALLPPFETRETLARLAAAGRMRPIIVVAIPANDDRLHEYGTAVALNDMGLGVLAPAYGHFVVEELMPLIERTFRIRPGAGILGVSLGGLSAFDIAWRYPDRFAVVGVMSGSFWWRAADHERRIAPGRRIAHTLARRAAGPPPFRLWFQAGTRDEVCDRDDDGIIDAIQDTTELIAELRALGVGDDQVVYRQTVGGRHDYETWQRVLPDFLQWAYSPGGRPGE